MQLITIKGHDPKGNAGSKVEHLVKDIFETEIKNGRISIETLTDTQVTLQGDIKTSTAVLVLDAKTIRENIQTRKDYFVDFRTEIDQLLKITKPEGSIIIVIYGDSTTKDLKEDQIVHDEWHSVLKLNDERAEYPWWRDRCFSLCDKFNDLQKRTLRNYMREISLFPALDSSHNVLVVGINEQIQKFREYLNRHPFLQLRPLFSETNRGVSSDGLFKPPYRGADSGAPLTSLYYFNEDTASVIGSRVEEHGSDENTDETEIPGKQSVSCQEENDSGGETHPNNSHVHSNINQEDKVDRDSRISKLLELLSSITDTLLNYIYGFYEYYWLGNTLPKFERILLLCNDGSSFKQIYSQREGPSHNVVQYFESKNIKTFLDVQPVLLINPRELGEEKNFMAETIKNCVKYDQPNDYKDFEDILESKESGNDWFLKMYIMYLCHAGYHEDFVLMPEDEESIKAIPEKTYTDTEDQRKHSNAVIGESNKSETMKQLIKIFTKLESYSTAQEKVRELLHGVFKEERDNATLFIEKYTDATKTSTVSYKTETALVVLDARQTRVLVTPRRRDAAVDHWNELQMLARNSKPNGSIILLIYGDESSKVLKDDEVLHDKWRQVFKFNDEHAEYSILQDRCFSLWEEFNNLQKRKLKDYMHEIALFPPVDTKTDDILVVGNYEHMQEFHKYLNNHPFLHVRQVNSNDSENFSQLELFKPSYQQAGSGETRLKLCYYNADIASIIEQSQTKPDVDETTERVDNNVADKQLESTSEDNGLPSGLSNQGTQGPIKQKNPSWTRRNHLTALHRTIVLCGDGTVFEKIRNPILRNSVEKYFHAKYIKLSNDILPVRVGDGQQSSHNEQTAMTEIMKNFIKHDHRENYCDCINILESHINDYKWLLKMYIMYLCHASCQDVPTDDGESGFCVLEQETKTSKEYGNEKSKSMGGECDKDDAGTNME